MSLPHSAMESFRFERLRRQSTAAFTRAVLRDFLTQPRAFGQPSAECRDKGVVAFAGLGPGSLGRRFWQGGCGRQPESDENRQGLDSDTHIAFRPRHAPIDLIEPFRESGFAAIGPIGRKERSDSRFSHQRLRLISARGGG